MHGPCVAPGALLYHTLSVPEDNISDWSELLVSLHSLLVIQRDDIDDYEDNYLRRLDGPVKIRLGESEQETEIGRVGLWYIDGSRAQDDELDIADICDSLGQAEYQYASAVYTNGTVDISSSGGSISNDVLVVHTLVLQPEYQDQGLEARIVWKIAHTVGYHCAAVVFDPERIGVGEKDELGLESTENPLIFCLTDF